MWLILKGFFASNVLKIAQIGLAVLSVALILLGARNSGKSAERAKNLSERLKSYETANKVRKDVRGISDSDVDKRLSKYFRE